MAVPEFGEHFDTEVLLEIETLRQLREAAKNRLMKNREWGGNMFFSYWLNHCLLKMIKITLSNVFVFKNGRDLSSLSWWKLLLSLCGSLWMGCLWSRDPTTSLEGGKWACWSGGCIWHGYPISHQKDNISIELLCYLFWWGLEFPSCNQLWHGEPCVDNSKPNVGFAGDPSKLVSKSKLSDLSILPRHPMHMRCWKEYIASVHARSGEAKYPICNFDSGGNFAWVHL